MSSAAHQYHPDQQINDEIAQSLADAERFDLAAGYPPRWWTCPDCSASHQRGHFMAIGTHRCLRCGYVGGEGVMHINQPGTSENHPPALGAK